MRRHALLDERLARLVDDAQPTEKRLGIARREIKGDLDFLESGERCLVVVAGSDRSAGGQRRRREHQSENNLHTWASL